LGYVASRCSITLFLSHLSKTGMNAMHQSAQTMAEQIAQAAMASQQQRTGQKPRSASVMLSGDTLVVTLHGALSPAEQAMAQSADGAAKVQEFHRQLFLNASDTLRQQIKRITGVEVHEGSGEVDPKCGPVVQVFPSGTMVQVFLLSGNVPSGSYNGGKEKGNGKHYSKQP
jgi:uncharacterized protein YbcI